MHFYLARGELFFDFCLFIFFFLSLGNKRVGFLCFFYFKLEWDWDIDLFVCFVFIFGFFFECPKILGQEGATLFEANWNGDQYKVLRRVVEIA